jgi:hypothetical protein
MQISEVFEGKPFKEAEFEIPKITIGDNRIIFAGLCPPKRSFVEFQHENMTSQTLIKILEMDKFDWIDVFPYTPIQKSSDVNMVLLEKFLISNPDFIRKWILKIENRILEILHFNLIPIVYICGKICKDVWNLYSNFNGKIIYESVPTILVSTMGSRKIYFVFGQHPSAQLTGHGNIQLMTTLKKNMHMLLMLFNGEFTSVEPVQKDEVTEIKNDPSKVKTIKKIKFDKWKYEQLNLLMKSKAKMEDPLNDKLSRSIEYLNKALILVGFKSVVDFKTIIKDDQLQKYWDEVKVSLDKCAELNYEIIDNNIERSAKYLRRELRNVLDLNLKHLQTTDRSCENRNVYIGWRIEMPAKTKRNLDNWCNRTNLDETPEIHKKTKKE